MADEPTGSKPADDQTQQPDVMPTQDETGTKEDPSVMPADQTPIIDDDPTIEKDGQKVVPFDSYKAEKDKRQELEKKLQEQQKPQATEQSTEETPVEESPDINWDELLGINQQPTQQPAQTTQPQQPAQPAQVSPDALRDFNESLREQRESGDELGALWRAGQFFTAQQDAMRGAAKRVVKDYDNLPLHTVDNTELQFFQQNPEALRAVLAKVKSGKGTTPQQPTPQPSNDGNNAQPADWQELIDKARQEGREETVRGLAASAGTTGEGTRAGTAPSGEVYELDEVGMDYVRKRGIPQEKWPEYAKLLQKENDMQGRY